jgi:predicted nucleic acid-binding protein
MTFSVTWPPIVIDASAAIEFLDGDARWRAQFERWAGDGVTLLTPAHFLAEVANGQLRSRRAPAADVAIRMERLSTAGIETADRGLAGLLEAIDLADRHGLTVYDALYLQLALDVDGELATLDKELRRAAEAEQVALTL